MCREFLPGGRVNRRSGAITSGQRDRGFQFVQSLRFMSPVPVPSPVITILIPSMLWHRCGGRRNIMTTADNLADVLEFLKREHAELHRSVCHETGAVRPHVNLFINTTIICKQHDPAAVSLLPGDSVTIMPAVSGG